VLAGQNSLGVAVVKGEDIFITQVAESYELKPCLKRLDEKKGQSKSNEEEEGKVTSVTMRFAGVNEEDFKRARENSYIHFMENVHNEQPTELDYIPESNPRSQQVLETMGRL